VKEINKKRLEIKISKKVSKKKCKNWRCKIKIEEGK
jgi:hypothetical protein